MKTFDNHLVGVTETRPHPESYRPDIPLNGDEDTPGAAYERGVVDGFESAKDEVFAAESELRAA